jgi:hypothetical protein
VIGVLLQAVMYFTLGGMILWWMFHKAIEDWVVGK